jgi:amino acid efflux transporter
MVTTASTASAGPALGPVRGTAMYVAAVLGPGILTLPALAAQKAGPAFLLALAALLALSAPLALTFAALGQHFPGRGLAQHVTGAFGERPGRIVAALFYLGVPPGVAALGLFGGGYLQSVVGGEHTALLVAAAFLLATWLLNGLGLRASATAQVALTGVLLLVVLVAVAAAVPHLDRGNFTPAAPHGWTALVPATFLLVWVLTGWEASANLAHALAPATLSRVVTGAVVMVAAAFVGLSVAITGVIGTAGLGNAPVADLLAETLGPAAVVVGVCLALVLTLGNMNAYVASLAAIGRTLPSARTVPGGPLTLPVLIALGSLLATSGARNQTALLVGVTAAAQVPVLVLAMAAGARLLPAGRARRTAVAATLATGLLLVPAGRYLAAPALIVAGVLVWELVSHRMARDAPASGQPAPARGVRLGHPLARRPCAAGQPSGPGPCAVDEFGAGRGS